jgi:hypothetical protein
VADRYHLSQSIHGSFIAMNPFIGSVLFIITGTPFSDQSWYKKTASAKF